MQALRARLVAAAALALAFVALTMTIAAGMLDGLDKQVLQGMEGLWSEPLHPLFQAVAEFGGLELTTILMIGLVVYLLRAGFGVSPDDPGYLAMRNAFLERYGDYVCIETRLFPGMAELLRELVQRRIAWGIVTNKSSRFTSRIVEVLKVAPACIVCGDSTPHLKPHPAPLLLAAQQLELPVSQCVYVGDDLRDIQAARAAGMRCVAVEYGYHSTDNPGPASWNADAVISHPSELLEHL